MKITVKLFATFRINRFVQEILDYPDGTTVGQVTAALGLPREELGILLVNHRHAPLDQVLNDGDTLALFPLLGGG